MSRFAGREAAVAYWRTIRDASDDFGGAIDRFDVIAPNVFTMREIWHGSARDGIEWEGESQPVVRLDDAGRLAAVDVFLPGDPRREEAIARVTATSGGEGPSVVRTRERFRAAFEAHDWDALRALYADDAVSVDHRPLGYGRAEGTDTLLRLLAASRTSARDAGRRDRSPPPATGSRCSPRSRTARRPTATGPEER